MKNFICKDCGADYESTKELERCPLCEKAREQWLENKIEQLNEDIIEKIGMEIQDERITSVKEAIESWENAIVSEEFKNDDHTGDLEIIEELKKYKDYDCLYSIDAEHGGVWGQGFVVIDEDINYIGFVRTI